MRLLRLAAGLGFFLAASAWAQAPVFEARPCADSRIGETARCGIVSVPEDRADPGGRRIALNLVILPATGEKRLLPLYDLAGGPGLPATQTAEFYLSFGGAYREGRDIVLLDQRGTGRSNGLQCPDLASPDRQYELFYPVERVAACRTSLSSRARLEHYGTDAAAADLEAVRQALGHDRIDLFGLSYGTLLALRYDQLFPGRARAMVLLGTATPEARVPSGHAPAGQRALTGLFAACAADPVCASRFPNPRVDLDRALTLLPGISGAPDRDVFLERLRSLMYAPARARMIPLILRYAADGDLRPFFAATRRTEPALDSDGVYLSIVCAEGMAGMDFEQASAAARNTLFGDYRLRRQRAACEDWPVAATAASFFDPPRPSASVLFVSGELDPVTPPDWAEAVAQRSGRARHFILSGGGHIPDGLSGIDTCLDPLLIAFLDHGDPNRLDPTCLAQVRPPSFLLEPPADWGMNSPSP